MIGSARTPAPPILRPYTGLVDHFFDEPYHLADFELETLMRACGTGDAASDQGAPLGGEEALAASSKSIRS